MVIFRQKITCCSPDVPACAVPVQAASRLAPYRLGAVQGFSVLPFFVTSFFENGDKKDRQLFAHCDQSTVSLFVILYKIFALDGLSELYIICTLLPIFGTGAPALIHFLFVYAFPSTVYSILIM